MTRRKEQGEQVPVFPDVDILTGRRTLKRFGGSLDNGSSNPAIAEYVEEE